MEKSRWNSAFSDQFQIKIILVVHHFFDAEIFAHKFLAGQAEPLSQFQISRQLQNFLRDVVNVASVNYKSRFIFETDFVRAVKVIGDDGLAGGEGLRQRARKRLAIGKMRDAIHDANVTRDFVRRNETGENDFVRQIHFARAVLQMRAQRAVSDEQQTRVGNLRRQFLKSVKQIVVPLEFEQSRNVADDKGIGGNF